MRQSLKSELQNQFRGWLQDEFSSRLRRNSSYSVRSFARQLNLDSSTLSKILIGKRNVSLKMIETFEEKLGKSFNLNAAPSARESDTAHYLLLQADAFTAISDWYHFAILDLTLLKNFKSDTKIIAKRLGIPVAETQIAIERLKRLGLLKENKGVLSKAQSHYMNYQEGQTSSALKEYQRQVLQKALHAIDNCPQEMKDITSMTIAGNSKKITEVKKKILKFKLDLCKFMEDESGDEVFHLAVQLYPVTHN